MPQRLPLVAQGDDAEHLTRAVDDEIREAPEDEAAGAREIIRPGSWKLFDRLEGQAEGSGEPWWKFGTELGGVVEGVRHLLVDGWMEPNRGRNSARHVTQSA